MSVGAGDGGGQAIVGITGNNGLPIFVGRFCAVMRPSASYSLVTQYVVYTGLSDFITIICIMV